MKKVVIGFFAGLLFATASTALADPIFKKITATVRTDYVVEVDGTKTELSKSPISYDGYSYLPIREIAEIVGKDVNFKDGVIKLERKIDDPAAELARLNKNLEIAKTNLATMEKSISDAENGEKELTPEDIKRMSEIRETLQNSVNFSEKRIADLLERFPELKE